MLSAEDAEVLVHRGRELVADAPWALAVRALEQRGQLALGVALDGVRHLDRRVRERPLRRVQPRALAVRDRLHERVPAEPVGAVHGDACALAGGVKAGELGLPPDVGGDATHVVVGSRPHRDRVVDRIHAEERHRKLARAGQPLDDPLRA